MKINTLYLKAILILMLFQFNPSVNAKELGEVLYEENCAGCHSISDNSSITLSQRLKEKAPTLFYAGNKFNPAWLENWLVEPKRIRPGGHFFLDNVIVTEEGDAIDESKLMDHILVSDVQAKQITEFLMAQTPKSDLIALEKVTFGKTNRTLGEKNFHKFKGCGSCHQSEDGYGGVSGPELYTSIQRLQPAFISSYIRYPEKWDPKTLMPNRHLNENAIEKLLNYLNLIAEQPE
ncbi:cytochrome c [Shewanella sp. D64]|uniref:c-type cytochrome n=1 Tax=unclassified Shewanella TaxID=196818 RepID=UPI0022BA5414|nr:MULTISPECIES: c-type cytochrome [unclassified Shewanella]MEC4727099.1 cytochrome c [Shewanella sp. D64]MEC4737838.1 cytochrome c [Shewanella sp. E94]WBJ93906.1 cytochrome c [Shewanella sp. MTB7]